MIYAVYRILYGEDFIKESLNSILDKVDKVFVFWTDKFFGDVSEVIYKGELIKFPDKIDNVIEVIEKMNNPKIELIYDHRPNNLNQFTERVNKHILPHYPKPEYILFMEPDFIYPDAEFDKALAEIQPLIEQGDYCFSTSQIEYWRNLNYVTYRHKCNRMAAMWWSLKNLKEIPLTGFHANIKDFQKLESKICNLGFCINDDTMFWKHMGSLAYSEIIGDSPPCENWYEDKWLNWNYDCKGKNYEIAKGYENKIPFINPSDKLELLNLPEELLNRFEINW